MLKKTVILLTFPFILTACDNAKSVSKAPADKPASTLSATAITAISTGAQTSPQKLTADGKIQVDWKAVDSGTPVIPPSEFKYPFALDSVPVKNYMNAYHVDAKTAQHNLTIGMGANEPLSKILDQIDSSYVSHELTAGKGSKLMIHTTSKVLPSEHDYIIADPFAKGLILPIQLIPDGKKDANPKNPHE